MNLATTVLRGTENNDQELVALARLLTYAKETAESLNAEAAVFCIESAIGAILKQLSCDMAAASILCEFVDSKAAQH